MKTKEINNFNLYTTGIISIEWRENDEIMMLNVDLDLAMLLKMMKLEGITYEEIQKISEKQLPIKFTKVSILLFENEEIAGQYYTSDCFTEEDDPIIFHAELKD